MLTVRYMCIAEADGDPQQIHFSRREMATRRLKVSLKEHDSVSCHC